MSPQRRSDYPGRGFGTPDQQQQQLQPPPQQLQGNDSGIETIQIDSSLVGLIIGRQGENLRRVEGETGTRVQFMTGPEAQGPHRLCKISGPRPAREHAKAEINRIIEDNAAQKGPNAVQDHTRMGSQPPALSTGEENTQIMVPNRTVGLIIGRGGETIRDLQQRSGCHVNIVGEEKSVNGLRPVNLIGTPQAAKVAKDLIMEIVESDNKTMATGGAGGGANVGGGGSGHPGNVQSNQHRGGDGGGGGGADKINDTIVVPSEAVGMIIGKGELAAT
jgi:far upstream element-binding protein